jgi:hypothetical protein
VRRVIAATLAAVILAGVPITHAAGSPPDKVTICHAAGRAGTTHYVELTISERAVYKPNGGHFYENGTPQAGHEQDYFGPCTASPEPECTGDPAVDPSGCPIDDCLPSQGPVGPECDPECTEDMPCFDCATMGNLLCAPPEGGASSMTIERPAAPAPAVPVAAPAQFTG